ncbi:YhcN/YlaJ family sporulation lipoprotein [Paenibacillus sp. 8b26]|uniref:YhcN/YlaJ family sporulation lipoprotein n=1 Tax=Paenibacillus sp. 8b26 TaxID=3424133 RepID=UPI003D648187
MPGTKKVISLTISAALLASMAALTGCGTANHNVRTNTTRYNAQSTHHMDGVNRFGAKSNGMDGMRLNQNANGTGHQIGNLQVDRNLSKRIAELPEVKSATVLVGDRNAYVAVSLKDQANGTGTGTSGVKGTGHSMNTHGTTTQGTTTQGTTTHGITTHGINGTRGNYTTDGTAPGLTDNGVNGPGTPARRGDGLYGTMGTGSYGMIRGLTDGTRTDIGRTDGTTVEGARTAYEPNTLTEAVKSRISNKVKQFAPSIEQVYVSANPDFVKHTTDFTRSVQNGHPIKGMSAQLADIIQRVFPTPAAGATHPTDGSTTAPTRPQNYTPAPMNHR